MPRNVGASGWRKMATVQHVRHNLESIAPEAVTGSGISCVGNHVTSWCQTVINSSREKIMQCKGKTVRGFTLDSLDAERGKVNEFYFDDQHWAIRCLIADT